MADDHAQRIAPFWSPIESVDTTKSPLVDVQQPSIVNNRFRRHHVDNRTLIYFSSLNCSTLVGGPVVTCRQIRTAFTVYFTGSRSVHERGRPGQELAHRKQGSLI